MRGQTRRRLLAFGLVLSGVTAVFVSRPSIAVLDAITAFTARPVLFGALLAGLYLVRPLTLLPVAAVSLLVGFVYGLVGLPVALAGAVVTSFPFFLLARYCRRDIGLFDRLGTAADRLVAATGGLRGVTVARLLPVPSDAVSYAAGLSGVSVWSYAAGTAVGEAPWVLAAVLAGRSMRSFTVSGAAVSPELIVGLLGLAALLLAGPVYRHWAERDPAR